MYHPNKRYICMCVYIYIYMFMVDWTLGLNYHYHVTHLPSVTAGSRHFQVFITVACCTLCAFHQCWVRFCVCSCFTTHEYMRIPCPPPFRHLHASFEDLTLHHHIGNYCRSKYSLHGGVNARTFAVV